MHSRAREGDDNVIRSASRGEMLREEIESELSALTTAEEQEHKLEQKLAAMKLGASLLPRSTPAWSQDRNSVLGTAWLRP